LKRGVQAETAVAAVVVWLAFLVEVDHTVEKL
jgi:hypothetical protein